MTDGAIFCATIEIQRCQDYKSRGEVRGKSVTEKSVAPTALALYSSITTPALCCGCAVAALRLCTVVNDTVTALLLNVAYLHIVSGRYISLPCYSSSSSLPLSTASYSTCFCADIHNPETLELPWSSCSHKSLAESLRPSLLLWQPFHDDCPITQAAGLNENSDQPVNKGQPLLSRNVSRSGGARRSLLTARRSHCTCTHLVCSPRLPLGPTNPPVGNKPVHNPRFWV
ncbi:hypothetical protein J6590_016472 [Homalodisca vitripennis]|nr:hypothetical protein J6590_016472 [Homalodisca vitripennis]